MSIWVQLMGHIGAQRDGVDLALGGPRQRTVLATVALSAGVALPTDRIVDLVWGDASPKTARRTVQSHIASLRTAFGPNGPLLRGGAGYVLNIDRANVDLLAFEDEVTEALPLVSSEPGEAALRLSGVLSRWSTPMADVPISDGFRALIAPFEELQLQAVEALSVARIDSGDAGVAVRVLESSVREHPTREHLWLQLARGLISLGRRNDALQALQRAREALREQLGIDPMAQIRILEQALLDGHEDVVAATVAAEHDLFIGAPVGVVRPTGTVTFLFTDIEGSTRLWERRPVEMQVALERHDAILRSVIEGHGGYVFATGGDSFAVAFARASAAIDAAVDAQRALDVERWPDATPIRVRMGLNTGEAQERDGDYFGSVLNRAAGVMGAGHGGQVLVSASTAAVVGKDELVDLGAHRLKKFSATEHLFQVAAEGLGSDFASLRTHDEVRGSPETTTRTLASNLSNPVSSIVGRDDDISQLAELISRSRLVTLRGLGGIGKTTLALHVAHKIAPGFEAGGRFVDIRRTGPASLLWETVRESLGLAAQQQQNPQADLLSQIEPLETLLIVDNCEERIDEIADLIEQILLAAPGVVVLATSRTSLGIAGEVVWQVDPLAQASAVELFIERAGPSRRRSALADNQAAIGMICRRLDGIPLAIELAASRLGVLSPKEILEHLDDRFELLNRRGVAGHDDERALQSVLEWSYELLIDDDRALLGRLSVFPGSFTLRAAHEVSADDADLIGVVDSLERLVMASLLLLDDSGDDSRYRLLETVRAYARSTVSSVEHRQIGHRHFMHCLELADRLRADHRVDHDLALVEGDRHLDDFRAAMSWAYDHEEPKLVLKLASRLGIYFRSRLMNRERMQWLYAGLLRVDEHSDETLRCLGDLLAMALDADDDIARWAAEQVRRSLDVVQAPLVRSRLLSSWAIYLANHEPRRADQLWAEATSLAKPHDPFEAIACISNRHTHACSTANAEVLDVLHSELRDFDVELVGDLAAEIDITAAALDGRWEHVITRALELESADELVRYYTLHERAEALGALNRCDEAIAVFDEHDTLEEQHGVQRGRSWSLHGRAAVELRRNRATSAREMLEIAAASWSTRPTPGETHEEEPLVVHVQLASLLGVCFQQLDDAETAAMLFGHAQHVAHELDVRLRAAYTSLTDNAESQCRANLGPRRFGDLATRGGRSTWTEIRQALGQRIDA